VTLLYPEAFWLFIPLLLLLIPAVILYRRGRRILGRLAGGWRSMSAGQVFFIKTVVEWLTIILFFVFTVLSLAGISWTRTPVRDDSSGLDVIFAVDVSRSMTAEDLSPSRLGRSAELIHSLLGEADRSGIVIFKGEGRVLVPLTEDNIAVEDGINHLSPSMYTVPGSDLSRGLARALEAFPEGSPARKVVILLSDGESLEGNPSYIARECRLRNITLFTVGVGSDEGSMIPGASGDPVQDETGQAVITRMDRGALMGIAEAGDGRFYDLADSGVPGQIVQDLQDLRGGAGAKGLRFDSIINYRAFLIIALCCLLLNLLAPRIRWSRWF
jgi:Ca-activated chloride channel family protein